MADKAGATALILVMTFLGFIVAMALAGAFN